MSEQPLDVDIDPVETQEWLDALSSVIREDGAGRGQFLLQQLADNLKIPFDQGTGLNTPYTNTIPVENEQDISKELDVATRLEAIIRWNAVMIVLRAGKFDAELGGHIATFQSAATLCEVGFNYFFSAAANKTF